jgi:L-fuculose-phosphate aldolase
MLLESDRASLAELGRAMVDQGLTKGVGGNLSQRADDDRIVITPSGIPYHDIDPVDVPVITTDGERVDGDLKPSSETPMHTMIYRERPDVGGIAHTHSPYATTFATLGQAIPPSHYLVSYVGTEVPVTGYEQPATEALGGEAVDALGDEYNGCLLRNHGVVAVGEDADAALETALMIEFCARIHYQATNVGDPIVLDDANIEELMAEIEEYRTLKD